MASRKSTPRAPLRLKSGVRSRRARKRVPDHHGSSPTLKAPAESAGGAIEAQRTQLRRACAVLDCVYFVLLYDDQFEGEAERPSYSDAVGVARDIVSAAMEGLDSVSLSRSESGSSTPLADLGAPHPSMVIPKHD